MIDLTVYDEIMLEASSRAREAVKEASKAIEYNTLSGFDGERENEYDLCIHAIAATIVDMKRQIEQAQFLKTHKHEWNEEDLCVHCGADGRA